MKLRKFLTEKGQALIEYVLIVSLISLATIGALSAAGVSLNNVYTNIAEKCEGGDTPTDPYDIAGCSIGAIEDQTYTGAAIEPAITVTTSEGTALTQDTDFTVTYENNTDVGLATVSITGIGDWHGSKTADFNIVSVTIESAPKQSGGLVYNGSKQSPVWNNYDEAQLELGGVTEGTDAAMYTATFTPKAGYTWADGSTTTKNVKWEIIPLALADSSVKAECADIEWEGGTLESPVTLKMNGTTLPSTLYKVTYITSTPKTASPYNCKCTANVQPADGNSNVVGSKAVYYTVTRKSYDIKFDMDGGSGGPGNLTKYYGIDLTIVTGTCTKTGYELDTFSVTSGPSITVTQMVNWVKNGQLTYTWNRGAEFKANWKAAKLIPTGIENTNFYNSSGTLLTPGVDKYDDVAYCISTFKKLWGTYDDPYTTGVTFANAASDKNGVSYTNIILPAEKDLNPLAIWAYCASIRTSTDDTSWYVPAIGELKAKYDSGVRFGKKVWSSTEMANQTVYITEFGETYTNPRYWAYMLNADGTFFNKTTTSRSDLPPQKVDEAYAILFRNK